MHRHQHQHYFACLLTGCILPLSHTQRQAQGPITSTSRPQENFLYLRLISAKHIPGARTKDGRSPDGKPHSPFSLRVTRCSCIQFVRTPTCTMVSIAYHSDHDISGILTISHGVLSFVATLLFLFRLYASWRTPHAIWTADVHISLIALVSTRHSSRRNNMRHGAKWDKLTQSLKVGKSRLACY